MFTENLAGYFSENEFGDVATFAVGTATGTSVNGIFDAPAANALDIEGQSPHFACAAADVPSARGATLTVRGTDYTVVGVDPDGQGGVVLKLQEDDAP